MRFSETDPAEHFYRNAIRFDQLFAELVFPLRDHRAVRIEADHAEETATAYCKKRYEIDDVDVVVLEGIYLLKRAFQDYYDLSVWIDCTFETALERAIARGQEGLPAAATIARLSDDLFSRPADSPGARRTRAAATVRINNDPRSAPPHGQANVEPSRLLRATGDGERAQGAEKGPDRGGARRQATRGAVS